jgi:flagellar hook-associated protein FlgK
MPDILGIGSSGLTAYRKLLETVGSNIVNANTEGYVRRDVSLQATGESTMLPTARPTSSGSGVLVDSVRRGTDSFLQAQTYNSNAQAKQSSTLADTLSQLEKSVFTNASNMSTEVQNFYATFSQLASSPTSTSTRLTLLDAGERVATSFRSAANQIQTNMQSVESAIDAALSQVNVITSQLARLNNEIARTAAGNQKPNDLLDQRDKLLQNLSDLTSFTTVEANNGSITLYLGDTASGQKLLSTDGAHQLGAIKTGERLDIAFDPNSNPSITTQIKSGTIAGLMDFRREATTLMQNVDRLAVGFASAVNQQHYLGVDQDGNQGKQLFSTDSLIAKAGTGNTGLTKMSLEVTTAAQLKGATYTGRFDPNTSKWAVTSSYGGSASGATNVSLDGVDFTFEGTFSGKDVFFAEPLKNAASGMRFLRKTPSEIAAALPLYVDQGTGNQGSGVVSVTNRNATSTPVPLPNAADIFSGTSLAGVDFLRNGAAFVIQAGTGPSSLTSLGTMPSLRFNASASDVLTLANSDGNGGGGLSLSFTLDAGTNGSVQRKLTLHPTGAGMADLAKAINDAAISVGASSEIYANVSGGALSISALGTHTISSGSLDGFTKAGLATSIKADTEQASSAASMRLFTRDGRQLTGPAMTESEAAAFVTTANGFLSEAFYRPPSVNTGYRGLNLSTANDLLSLTLASKTSATIDVAQSLYNQVPAANGNGTSPGAVYGLDIVGLPPIRLAGDAIGANDAAGISDLLTQQINSFATRRSWLGNDVTVPPNGEPLHFTVSIDGQDHQVTYSPGSRPSDASAPTLPTINTQAGTVSAAEQADVTFSNLSEGQVLAIDGMTVRATRDMTAAEVAQAFASGSGGDAIVNNYSTSQRAWTAALKSGFNNVVTFTSKQATGNVTNLIALDGSYLNTGSFSITGPLDLKINLVPNADIPSQARMVITAPATMRALPPDIKISADAATSATLGVSAKPTSTILTAAAPPPQAVMNGNGTDTLTLLTGQRKIRVKGTNTPEMSLFIDRTSGTNGNISWQFNSSGNLVVTSSSDSSLQIVSGTNNLHLQTLTIDQANNSVGGFAWKMANGKLSLTSSDPDVTIIAETVAQRDSAKRLGFLGADLDVTRSSQVTGATELVPSLLSARKPKLHLMGNVIGDKTIVLDSVSGQSGGISWSIQNDKLVITSSDSSLKVLAQNTDKMLAEMLGFTGNETAQNGILSATNNLASSLLETQPVTVTLADNSRLTINAASGQGANGTWSIVDGRLRISSPYLAASVAAGNANSQQAAQEIGFLGPQRDTPGDGSVTAAASLDEALLAGRAPQLRVSGTSVGAISLTLTGTSGSSNGVSWTTVNGRLQLRSDDPSLRIDTSTTDYKKFANALGFGGQETFDGSGALIATTPFAETMLATSPATFNLADGSSIAIDAPKGLVGATSWEVIDGHLKISGPTMKPGLQRNLATDDANAASLGFNGNDEDTLSIGTQIKVTSTAADQNNNLIDTSASRSVAGSKIDLASVAPEDMIVQLDNQDINGLRRIAARLGTRDTSAVPFPNITVKVLSNNKLEIIDRKSGVSLATRSWIPDQDVSYLGISFHISGNAQAGDVFDISNDATRSGDSRNAQSISSMSTRSIFGENRGSFTDIYTTVAGTLGSTVNSAELAASSSNQTASDLKSAYEAKTGVNLDKEAADLIRFQQAYQAAAQVVSSARQMFETILRSF